MKYIDTHGHLNSDEFKDELELYVNKAKEVGVEKIIVPSTSQKDSLEAIKIAKQFKDVYALIAVHPNHTNEEDADWLDSIDPNDILGIGETGIDLYYDDGPSLEKQINVFLKHLDYAKKHNKPIAIHMRDSEEEIYKIISSDKYKDLNYVIHCSTTTYEWNKKFVDLGAYISFSGIVTFKNAKQVFESMQKLPLNRIIAETDAPYLAPVPKRGKMNEPSYVKYTCDFIALNREESQEEVLNALWNNALKVFGIGKDN